MTNHDLKLNDKYFDDVVLGFKTFEVRKNDRDYKVGDTLTLHRVDDNGCYMEKAYKGWTKLFVEVTYILTHEDFPAGVPEGYVVMSIKVPEVVDE